MIILILFSGIMGWILTQQIENSNNIIDIVHLLKESELQLRREEKNLLIRVYSPERYLRWQTAKEEFHQKFGELIAIKTLTDAETIQIKTEYSEMSKIYSGFFDEILTKKLSLDQINNYDDQFKEVGRKTLGIINNILVREQNNSAAKDTQANILIAVFLIIFTITAGFLIVNVLKHL